MTMMMMMMMMLLLMMMVDNWCLMIDGYWFTIMMMIIMMTLHCQRWTFRNFPGVFDVCQEKPKLKSPKPCTVKWVAGNGWTPFFRVAILSFQSPFITFHAFLGIFAAHFFWRTVVSLIFDSMNGSIDQANVASTPFESIKWLYHHNIFKYHMWYVMVQACFKILSWVFRYVSIKLKGVSWYTHPPRMLVACECLFGKLKIKLAGGKCSILGGDSTRTGVSLLNHLFYHLHRKNPQTCPE